MKTDTSHGTFEDALANSSSTVGEMATSLRELIIDVYPDVVEVPWPRQHIVGYGVGPKKMSEHFCYIAAYQEYVNLGFYYGASLSDRQGLLEGTGKKLRHIKVRDAEEVNSPEIRQLVELAVDERVKALGRK